MSDPSRFVDQHYARSVDYSKDLTEIAAAQVCPFCPENFHWHPNPVLREDGQWLITRIRENYENADQHFLIICREHKEWFGEVSGADWEAVSRLAQWVADEFGITGGAMMLRFGDTRLTGATVRHLHFHLTQPVVDPATNRAIPVYFPIG
jgi:ATP adenylyltransferase